MPKGVIKIPKENQDCKDGKCGHTHEYPFEINEPPKQTQPASFVMENSSPQQTIQVQPPVEEKPKKLTHEEIGEIMPKGLNFMSCPGGDCGHQKIKNPKPVKKFKTCPNGNCGANTVPKGSEYCPTCGKGIDEDEDLEDGVSLADDEDE